LNGSRSVRIREWNVVSAGTSELGVGIDGVANIDNHDEWRPAMLYFCLGQSTNVSLGLSHCGINSVLLTSGCQLLAGLLSFQHKAVPTIQIDVPVVGIAIDTSR